MKFSIKRVAVWGIAGYLLLLVLLTFAESTNPNSSISSIADAFWYSIVTLSTVGYGDMYPVTLLGRIIGICFVLMSLGVLSLIMGAIVSFLTGWMLPAMQLYFLRKRTWYVFDHANEVSLALAADLEQDDPDAIFLFPLNQSDRVERKKNYHFYPETMAQAVKGKENNCSLFFLDLDHSNYTPALEALSLGHPVYCRTRQVPDTIPAGLTLFNRYSCCGQEYWRTLALGKDEHSVVILGDGQYAQQLLEQGLLVNVFGYEHPVSYHVFGSWTNFRRNHSQLDATLSIDQRKKNMDSLFFHSEAWNADAELLRSADRIILCSDDDRENLDLLRQLRRYFPTTGRLHLRAAGDIPGETVFGTNQKIYTADLVMGTRLTDTARMMHQIYADSAEYPVDTWEDLSEFMKQSNIAAADHLLTKVRILLEDDSITTLTKEVCSAAYDAYCKTCTYRASRYREIEHLRWMRFHSLYNWRYAPVRDNSARLHPLMVPYDALPLAEQAKDDYAWELIGKIADRMK